MSYDTSIIDPDTGAELADLGNMTSNVGAIYRRAMPGPYEGGGRYNGVGEPEPQSGLPGLSGLRCRDAAPILRAGVQVMLAEGDAMIAMEPDNGWGSYAGALVYLCSILFACADYPDGVLAVSW
jgi:hypothetical protein